MFFRILSLFFLLSLPCYVSAASVEDISKINDHCNKISSKLASVAYKECLSHNLELTEGFSVNGLPIIVKNIDVSADEHETGETTYHRVLIIGGFHGNEYSSVSVLFKWMTILDQYYAGSYQWQIIPLLNPDGLLQRASRRANANGVDLDRNFPVSADGDDTNQHWEENTILDPDYYPGEDALSEPESRWLAEEIQRYQPDAVITIHAPINSHTYKSSNSKQSKNGAQYQQSVATHPGSFNQYVGTGMNIPILTVELPYADIMPTKTEVNDIWKNLIKWLNTHIESS